MLAPMNRLVLALVIAPLWVPLFVGSAAYWLLSSLDPKGVDGFVIRLMILSAGFSWGATLVLWLPAMRFLARRRLASAWTAMAVGFFAAPPTFVVAFLFFGLVMSSSLEWWIQSIVKDLRVDAGIYANYAAVMAVLGAIVGLTAWLIGRPQLRAGSRVRPG